MALSNDRWLEVTASQFEHETKGLKLVRQLLPDHSPYRAWSNFEFRDNHGRWHEVDLLVLGRAQLHLVELKYYSGVLTGDDHRWLRPGKRAEDSPLKLARRKAQYLASRLQDAARDWERETGATIPDIRQVVPFVQESVFLHHPRFQCELSDQAAQGLYGLDGAQGKTLLPGISELLLEPPRNRRTTSASHERLFPELMKRLGLVARRERTAGSWVIEEAPLNEGTGWQDWRANHQVDPTQHARIRFRVPPPGATEATTRELRRLAQHEFGTMSRLVHDGLLRPVDIVDSDLGTGLVYPLEKSLQRLDLWLAEQPQGLSLDTQLNLIRQIAEAVHYAHGSAVAHRDLTPEAIWVRSHSDDSIKVLVGDWHSAGVAGPAPPTDLPADGVTALHRSGEIELASTEQATYAAYRAPEDVWQTSSTDRFRLDVFGVGALAFYVLTGEAPAAGGAALRDRLREQGGLDISPELPAASEPLRALVLGATKPSPSERTADLATFLEQLADAERTPHTSTEPDLDPLEARPGAILDGRYRLERRLGQGSTAVGLLVTDLSASGEPERVLKVALDDNAARRLTDEAEVLRRLNSPRLVRLLDGPIALSGRQALLLEVAGTQTLAEVLRERTRMSLDLLQRYGTDLLEALAALDKTGVDHRDIKPANLGVRTSKGDRAKHLVLFDFSLTRAAASATEAGTPPYLDPFLATETRPRYDSPAERYAASVVLFEMATGTTPTYGEGDAHPGSITAEATVPRSAFDPSIAKAMVAFFTKALARDAEQRHHTATEMLREWESAFPPSVTTVPDNADELAAAARLDTPLGKAGLSARALSAVEPLHVETVGDLVALDAVRLNQFSGAADVTRKEVKGRAKEWRTRFADAVRESSPANTGSSLPSPQDAAELLMAHTGKGRSQSRRETARLLFGVGTELDAFATQAQLGAHLITPVGAARATQLLSALQDGWADHHRTLNLLILLEHVVQERLNEVGCVATVDELTHTLLTAMTPRSLPTREAEREEHRLVLGLLRAVLDRQRALVRADAEVEPLHTRRREG
ncbi:MAG: BREX system serine/threonine kinase PglW, partial [Ornithinimicrobium sp.]|uniref:BREX system serine/threonine kinase PglW n=1 Tax=Ornithinimicrobium sp. TaxID=1977084 RepID=UPI003D9BCE89